MSEREQGPGCGPPGGCLGVFVIAAAIALALGLPWQEAVGVGGLAVGAWMCLVPVIGLALAATMVTGLLLILAVGYAVEWTNRPRWDTVDYTNPYNDPPPPREY